MRSFLPSLLAKITGVPRYTESIEWDKNIWIVNIFRAWEKVFGRKFGIRKEAMTSITLIDGKPVIKHQFYTLEAVLAHIEVLIRSLFKDKFLYIHVVDFQLAIPNQKLNIPFIMYAIALDANANGTVTSTTPLTFTHTCTGSNLYLKVGVGLFATSPTISTPTYNSVSMTLEGSQRTNVAHMCAMYQLVAPSTGANTVSCGFGGTSPFCNAVAVSYSGCAQSGQPDSSNGNTGAGSPSVTVTTIADNCWSSCVISAISVSGGSKTTRGGVLTLSGTSQMEYQDSNGVKTPAGNVTFAWSAGTTTWAAGGGSFAPFVAAATLAGSTLPLLNAG